MSPALPSGSQGWPAFVQRPPSADTITFSCPGPAGVAVAMPPGFTDLMTIATSIPVWFRLYNSQAQAQADAGRTFGADPAANSGLIAGFRTTSTVTFNFNPIPQFIDTSVWAVVDSGPATITLGIIS